MVNKENKDIKDNVVKQADIKQMSQPRSENMAWNRRISYSPPSQQNIRRCVSSPSRNPIRASQCDGVARQARDSHPLKESPSMPVCRPLLVPCPHRHAFPGYGNASTPFNDPPCHFESRTLVRLHLGIEISQTTQDVCRLVFSVI